LGTLIVVAEFYVSSKAPKYRRIRMIALDRATGKVRWTVQCPRGSVWSKVPSQVSGDNPANVNPIVYSCKPEAGDGYPVEYAIGENGKASRV
jgi:hypothetical protein